MALNDHVYLVSCCNKHEHAVNADICDNRKTKRSSNQSCVMNRHWQCQDTDPYVAFQDVDDGLKISGEKKFEVLTRNISFKFPTRV